MVTGFRPIAGLAAAIPALVGYNVLVRNVHRKETVIDLFISRVIEGCVTSSRNTSRHNDAEAQGSEAMV